jgi:glutaredoxin
MNAPVRVVTLISRRNCHLCDEAAASLRALSTELSYELHEIDVDSDHTLQDEYSDRVPVILIDGREHGYWRLEEARFRRAMAVQMGG